MKDFQNKKKFFLQGSLSPQCKFFWFQRSLEQQGSFSRFSFSTSISVKIFSNLLSRNSFSSTSYFKFSFSHFKFSSSFNFRFKFSFSVNFSAKDLFSSRKNFKPSSKVRTWSSFFFQVFHRPEYFKNVCVMRKKK